MADADMIWSRKDPFGKRTRTPSIHRTSASPALLNRVDDESNRANQRLRAHSGTQFDDFKRIGWEAFAPECLLATARPSITSSTTEHRSGVWCDYALRWPTLVVSPLDSDGDLTADLPIHHRCP